MTTETQPTAVAGDEDEPRTEFEAVLAGLGQARKVGRYTLLELLGSGGMGVVFTAYDEELDRKVAIKFLQRSAGAAQAGALLREAQAQARLAHPNVIHVYEVGVADGRVFLAMEFVRGLGLREWSRAGRSRAEVVEVFVQAGRGLAAAHAAGVVHCDFKPENVLVGHDGRVRVLDFGLARHSGARVEDAPGGGTPGYMAPEQFEGREVDARSDQFSFCVALFEALYGQRPFVGGSLPALMLAVIGGEVVTAAGEARVPARLRRAVRRGLARAPADRHAGMTALLTELELVQPRPRGRWAIAAAVSAALTTSAWWAASGGEDAAAVCAATAAAEVAAVWGEAPRAAIGRVFAATELAYAGDSFERTARLLDAYADAWAQVRRRTCELGDGTVDRLAERCLERRRVALAAWVDTLRRADAAVVEEAVAATSELQGPEVCGDPSALLAADDGEADREIEGLLARARAEGLAGQHARGVAPAREAQRLAEARGRPRLVAEALLRLGLLHEHTGAGAEAASSFAGAYFTAEAARDEVVRAEAAVHLVHVTGGPPRSDAEDALWSRLAEAVVRGRGAAADGLQAMLLQHRSSAARERGDAAAAVVDLEAALVLERGRLGAGHPALAAIDEQLGEVLAAAGRTDEALVVLARAIAGAEAALGAEHPTTARRILARGAVHERRGELAAALADYERALAVWERAFGEHPRLIWALTCVGRVLRATSAERGRAASYYARALAIAERAHGAADPQAAYACVELAGVLAEDGRAAEARELYARALRSLRDAADPLAAPLIEIGEAMLVDGDAASAVVALERARLGRGVGEARGRVEFALARALWATGERDRALALARGAADGGAAGAGAWLAERL